MNDPYFPRELAEALADDAETLAVLHDREIDPQMLKGLRTVGFPDNLALLPSTDASRKAWRLMAAAIGGLPAEFDEEELDRLAADYAAIYLTAAYGASPSESTWTDEDHLVCQEAMFQLREIHRAAGLAAADWRRRSDDHLVLQLAHLAHAFKGARQAEDWRRIAGILDEHLLRWLPDFAGRVAHRCETPFYAGLAMLTAAWVDQLRDLIADYLAERRPSREEIEKRLKPSHGIEGAVAPLTYVPGVGPTL